MYFSRFLKAIRREPVDCTPIWVMRQAGRYLPEYRAIREQVGGFLGMCKNPEIAATITLQPITRFGFDAAIIFSDILTIPDALGLGLHFKKDEGPHFASPIQNESDVKNLPSFEVESLDYVYQAIRFVKPQLRVPLIGFCGSPWTVATYMVEGKSSKNFSLIKRMMFDNPTLLHALLSKVAEASKAYLKAQIIAGADCIQIFDTWGGVLSPKCYRDFSLKYMQEIVQFLKSDPATGNTPIILFTKQGGQWLEDIVQTKCDVIGLDWTVDLALARKRVGDKVALQGNLDPSTLYADPNTIVKAVKEVLSAYGEGSGHIFNLGHGIYPDVPPEHVQVLIEAVRSSSLRGA